MTALVTIEEADAYIDTKLNDGGWSTLLDDVKTKAINEASMHVQRVPFLVLPDPIDDIVKNAVCEEIIALLEVGDNVHTINQKLNIKSISFGDDSVSYSNDGPKPLLSIDADRLLRDYVQGSFRIV